MFCRNCGEEIKKGVQFCPYCGNAVAVKTKPVRQQKDLASVKKIYKWVVPICILVFVCVVAVAVILIGGKDDRQEAYAVENEDVENDDIENEDVENNDVDNEIEKVEIEESNQEEVKEDEVVERTYIYAKTPEEALSAYVYFLVDAINKNDYSGAETVMVMGSALYNEQKNLVPQLNSRGITEQVVECRAESTENIDDNHVRVISNEKIAVSYNDGTEKLISQRYGYICELTKDGWLLTDIEKLD